jgi:hypothetical protein
MDSFVHEDGKGNFFDDEGKEVSILDMEVDEESYLK